MPRRPVWIWAIAAWCSLLAVAAADAPPCTTGPAPACSAALPRPQDEVWLISSRGFSCGVPANIAEALTFWRYESGSWIAAKHSVFADSDPARRVTMFAHGNDIDLPHSIECGWSAYAAQIHSDPRQEPVRFVIYSWPSEKAGGRAVVDVREKCVRADIDAYCMAWLIDGLEARTPLSLGGYSLGTRIVGGALELIAGGALDGRPLAGLRHPHRAAARVVLFASAIDNDWLLPGRRYGLAMSEISHLMLLNNTCDRALRFYPRIYCRHGGPEALGYTGLASPDLLGAERAKLEQFDVCCQIGPQHNWMHYTQVPAIAVLVGRGLTGEAIPASPAK